MTFDFVEVDDCVFMERQNCAVFYEVLQSALEFLAQNVQLFVAGFWLVDDYNALLSPLGSHVVNKVKHRHKGVGYERDCPKHIPFKDTFNRSFGIYL